LASRDQTIGLDGVAGAGKTTTLAVVREEAERRGYDVSGLAPTSRAAQQLAEAGIPAVTLQRHLVQHDAADERQKHLYVLDESSLASTRQMHALFERLGPEDRLLLVGDARQHRAVEAGQPFQQLQAAGMDTAHLDEIVRQRDPALKAVVEQLSRGEVREAVDALDRQGHIHQIANADDRFAAIARDYVSHPEPTLVVSPDNASRREINARIHEARQAVGQVDRTDVRVTVLVPRQDLTGADRQWAARYEPGEVLRYTTGSRTQGLAAGEYVHVERVDAEQNRLTVARDHGSTVTYDPRRLQGVTVYREADRAFAVGDRVQTTAPDRAQHLANRELGTIETIDRAHEKPSFHVRLDSGRTVDFSRERPIHLDYGYAVTSHSSQGQTADRVLVHVDTHQAEALVNSRFAYVAVSRSRFDAQIYTDDATRLPQALGRESSHATAIELTPRLHEPAPAIQPSQSPVHTIDHGISR
jgi:ATP-dependent exoDNAse (exonuclease V) alpha subunit